MTRYALRWRISVDKKPGQFTWNKIQSNPPCNLFENDIQVKKISNALHLSRETAPLFKQNQSHD